MTFHLFALAVVVTACGDDGSSPIDAPIAIDAAVDAPADAPVARINGCTRAQATDATAAGANRMITLNDNDTYTPPCLRIRAGQTVTWIGDFDAHPLEPGIVVPGDVEPQPGSPIVATSSGSAAQITFAATGEWGFFCPNHLPGMVGAVFVDP